MTDINEGKGNSVPVKIKSKQRKKTVWGLARGSIFLARLNKVKHKPKETDNEGKTTNERQIDRDLRFAGG